jgi:hypothetical protein
VGLWPSFKQKNVGKDNKRQHFQKFSWRLSTINNLHASDETTLCFWFRGSSTFAGTVPGFGAATGRHRIQYGEQFSSEAQ